MKQILLVDGPWHQKRIQVPLHMFRTMRMRINGKIGAYVDSKHGMWYWVAESLA